AAGAAASSSATLRSAASYTAENAWSNESSSASGRLGRAIATWSAPSVASSANARTMRRPSTRNQVIAISGSHGRRACQLARRSGPHAGGAGGTGWPAAGARRAGRGGAAEGGRGGGGRRGGRAAPGGRRGAPGGAGGRRRAGGPAGGRRTSGGGRCWRVPKLG